MLRIQTTSRSSSEQAAPHGQAAEVIHSKLGWVIGSTLYVVGAADAAVARAKGEAAKYVLI